VIIRRGLGQGRRPRGLAWLAGLALSLGPVPGALAAPPLPPSELLEQAPTIFVCLLAPHVEAMKATVPLRRPTLFAAEPLAEVRILRRGQLLWRRGPSNGPALEGPMAWPLDPIQAGEEYTLLLRPLGSPPTAFAVVRLVGATAARLERNENLLARLAGRGQSWRQVVEQSIQAGDLPLASALLFAVEGPSTPELDALRLAIFRQACSGP
jgi:hypothetical protein